MARQVYITSNRRASEVGVAMGQSYTTRPPPWQTRPTASARRRTGRRDGVRRREAPRSGDGVRGHRNRAARAAGEHWTRPRWKTRSARRTMRGNADKTRERDYVPAAPQIWLYDTLVALLTREARWRPALLRQLDPQRGDAIADVGCGTGTLLALVARTVRPTALVGIDPDPEILERARRKIGATGAPVDPRVAYLRDTATILAGQRIDKIVSSLVFHQVPMAEKEAGLNAMRAALVPGGTLHVADYGLQRTALMRRLFRIVGAGDGYENTEPNARGVLPALMREAGFQGVEETEVVPTPTGSISLYRAERGTSSRAREG